MSKFVSIATAGDIAAVYRNDDLEPVDMVHVVVWALDSKGKVVGLTPVDDELVPVDELDDFVGYQVLD